MYFSNLMSNLRSVFATVAVLASTLLAACGDASVGSDAVGATAGDAGTDGDADATSNAGQTSSVGSETHGGDDNGDSGGDGCGSSCPGTHFDDEAILWAIPSDAFRRISSPNHLTFDIDGDGRPELVQTRAHDTEVALGGPDDPHWLVYDNLGDGFAATPVPWPVPSIDFDVTASGSHFLHDLDADGRPELIVTREASMYETFGGADDPHWRVHQNTGAGFSVQPLQWSVPTERFDWVGHGFALLDIDADGDVELLELSELDPDSTDFIPGGHSDPHWRVFANEGSGFSSQAQAWSVPAANIGYTLSGPEFSLLDLDGDGPPDVVIATVDPNDGAPEWWLFRNHGSGFDDEPTLWEMPEGVYAVTAVNHKTFDLRATGRPEIVQHRSFDPESFGGTPSPKDDPYWRVFPNNGSGFDEWIEWPVPDHRLDVINTPLFDIDGDGRVDLVVLAEPDSAMIPEGLYWLVYRNTP